MSGMCNRLFRAAHGFAAMFSMVAACGGADGNNGTPDGPGPDAAAPTTPTLLAPLPDVYVGRHSAAGTLRATFSWKESTVIDSRAIKYELQFSPDAMFAANVTEATSDTTSYMPAADFAVSQTPPVGTRYYWRVRACTSAKCGEYSKARWVNFGRNHRDFNGDGFSDVVAGAHNNPNGGDKTGRAYIYFGGAGGAFNGGADGVINGGQPSEQFGVSVAPVGDLNGDGFTDLAIGATLSDGPGATDNVGSVSIYLGGPGATFDTTADATMFGTVTNARFGRQVASAGDVNGDGYGDLIVGAHYPEATGVGRAYVYYGGPGAFDKVADGTLSGDAGESFGCTVASAGDINRDGYADVIIGAYLADVGSTDAGRALVYLGGSTATFDSTADQVLSQDLDDWFGYSVASAGDLNGDGYADVAVGAPSTDTAPAGRVYVYFGGATGTLAAEPSMTYTNSVAESFGRSVSSAGDLNGDGADDLIVGAYLNNAVATAAGRIYVYYGGKGTLDTSADGILTGAAVLDVMGNSVALAGDVNADGFSDVIVGVSGSDAACGDCGRALIYFGRAGTFDNVPRGTLNGTVVGEQMGYSVASHTVRPVLRSFRQSRAARSSAIRMRSR